MKRIQRGPVRGISLKLQEEERERRMDFVPEKSALETDSIEVDRDTMDMLKSMNMGNLQGVSVSSRTHYNKVRVAIARKRANVREDNRSSRAPLV